MKKEAQGKKMIRITLSLLEKEKGRKFLRTFAIRREG